VIHEGASILYSDRRQSRTDHNSTSVGAESNASVEYQDTKAFLMEMPLSREFLMSFYLI
jgi:hypothetical protein